MLQPISLEAQRLLDWVRAAERQSDGTGPGPLRTLDGLARDAGLDRRACRRAFGELVHRRAIAVRLYPKGRLRIRPAGSGSRSAGVHGNAG